MKFRSLCALMASIPAFLSHLSPAFAVEPGVPHMWGYNFQASASKMMDDITWFKLYTEWFIIPIVIFVFFLMVYTCWRFREKANPKPSKNAHNTTIEIIWTVVPVLILIAIALPSFDLLLNKQYGTQKFDMTVKAIGNQWYWTYEYNEGGKFKFDSVMLADKDITDKAKQPRLLAVDNEMVVPVGKTIRVITTASDVIHAFTVPAFGVTTDAVPGRLNEAWFKAEKAGVYYGQCAQLCGRDHSFMPIAVRVLPEAEFKAWLETARKKFAATDTIKTAAAQ